jgi:hypothetical protein
VVGRPTKRTPEREQRLLDALRAGNTRLHAARYAGVGENTFGDWLRHFRDFRDLVEKAEADAIVRHVANIAKAAADGQWTASAWWLERRYPQDYALRFQNDAIAAAGVQVTIAFDHANQDTTTLSLSEPSST